MYEIRKHKSEIREYYIGKRRALEEDYKKEHDNKICTSIISSVTFRYAKVILMYLPKADEIDITPVAKAALETGKKVAFPRCNPEDKTMKFHFVDTLDDFEPGSYGMPEPCESLPVFEPEESENTDAICIVPAVVYDRQGFRIGYGGGYYDRYLSSFHGTKVGVTYYDFIANTVPHGRFDFAVDVIMTERGVYGKKK